MEDNAIKVPQEMLEAAGADSSGCDPCGFYLVGPLRGAIKWLLGILQEGDVNFHNAILKRAQQRYGSDITNRVAFEFGASFARQYIGDLFRFPEPGKQESIDTPLGRIVFDDRVPPGEIRMHSWTGPTVMRNIGQEKKD